ncbi:MAG: hypothetical protein M1324_02755 [Patescibacteria group bacterium]|nr:hypothetical protein [Patescibacteria group bacterium]
MENNKKKPKDIAKSSEKRLPLWLRWLILTAFIILILVIIFLLVKPLRTYSAQKYISEGDTYLADKQYLHADLAYEKALIIFPGSKVAQGRRALVTEASRNILILEDFYKQNNFNNQKDKLDEALAFPKEEIEGVRLSKQLIEEKEYQLAIIPAKTATEMDDGYRDAWLYLGIANLKTAELVDLSSEVRALYVEKAKDAFNKAKTIDPESKDVNDYLKILES